MEFVDYKCLESLLIQGEELIATESSNTSIKLTNSDINDFISYKIPSSVNEFLKEGLKVEGTYKPFAITAFGEILAYERHYLYKISFEENKMHIIGTKEYESDLKDPGFLKDYFNMEDYMYARKTLGKLKPGEIYGYQPIRPIGGTKANLAKVKFEEYVDFCIQMNGPIT